MPAEESLDDMFRQLSPRSKRPSLVKRVSRSLARFLLLFCIGVAATLAWQSYRDATREEMIAATPASLDLVRQSVDKLAVEITKLQAAEQDILDRISTPAPRSAAASARNPMLRPSQTSPLR